MCFMLIGSWEGGKNFGVGFFLNRVGLQETNNFFLGLINGIRPKIMFVSCYPTDPNFLPLL